MKTVTQTSILQAIWAFLLQISCRVDGVCIGNTNVLLGLFL